MPCWCMWPTVMLAIDNEYFILKICVYSCVVFWLVFFLGGEYYLFFLKVSVIVVATIDVIKWTDLHSYIIWVIWQFVIAYCINSLLYFNAFEFKIIFLNFQGK